jgi:phosphate transport system permease protein
MAEVAPAWARNITRPAMEVFVGIPSVVYGFLGLTILVPFLRTYFRAVGFTLGFSWLAGSLVLALMILPTITAIAYDAFISIPGDMRSASLALGTTAGRRSATSDPDRSRRPAHRRSSSG